MINVNKSYAYSESSKVEYELKNDTWVRVDKQPSKQQPSQLPPAEISKVAMKRLMDNAKKI